MKNILFTFFSLIILSIGLNAQDSTLVTIQGYAPAYLGQEIRVCAIQDYLSDREETIARAKVDFDSTFTIQFSADATQKIVVRGLNNRAWMYVEPGASYEVFFPDRDPYIPPVKTGNIVELAFNNLAEDDINFKILAFQRWTDDYMSRYYPIKRTKPAEFQNKLDTFKLYVQRYYENEDDLFMLTYVRFSIAQLDEIEFAGSRNRYEKYDFYIGSSPVYYKNDAYMTYVNKYYKNFVPRLSNKTNAQFYDAVLRSSPTLVMKALGTEYSLKNLRIREYVMIKALSEVFYSDDFPQTNIMAILDSVKERALFDEHKSIANNIIYRLTDLVPGAKGPSFVLPISEDSLLTHFDLKGKHTYLHFYDVHDEESILEINILKQLHEKYGEDINFVSIGIQSEPSKKKEIVDLPWIHLDIPLADPLLNKFRVNAYPYYVLLDAANIVLGAPALKPTPNGKYETIERTFYDIQRFRMEMQENK